eukprot:gene12718-biopygen15525
MHQVRVYRRFSHHRCTRSSGASAQRSIACRTMQLGGQGSGIIRNTRNPPDFYATVRSSMEYYQNSIEQGETAADAFRTRPGRVLHDRIEVTDASRTRPRPEQRRELKQYGARTEQYSFHDCTRPHTGGLFGRDTMIPTMFMFSPEHHTPTRCTTQQHGVRRNSAEHRTVPWNSAELHGTARSTRYNTAHRVPAAALSQQARSVDFPLGQEEPLHRTRVCARARHRLGTPGGLVSGEARVCMMHVSPPLNNTCTVPVLDPWQGRGHVIASLWHTRGPSGIQVCWVKCSTTGMRVCACCSFQGIPSSKGQEPAALVECTAKEMDLSLRRADYQIPKVPKIGGTDSDRPPPEMCGVRRRRRAAAVAGGGDGRRRWAAAAVGGGAGGGRQMLSRSHAFPCAPPRAAGGAGGTAGRASGADGRAGGAVGPAGGAAGQRADGRSGRADGQAGRPAGRTEGATGWAGGAADRAGARSGRAAQRSGRPAGRTERPAGRTERPA